MLQSPKHKGDSNALSNTEQKGMSTFSPWSHAVSYNSDCGSRSSLLPLIALVTLM